MEVETIKYNGPESQKEVICPDYWNVFLIINNKTEQNYLFFDYDCAAAKFIDFVKEFDGREFKDSYINFLLNKKIFVSIYGIVILSKPIVTK